MPSIFKHFLFIFRDFFTTSLASFFAAFLDVEELYLLLLGSLEALSQHLHHHLYHHHRHSCLSLERTSQRVYKGDLQNEWAMKPLWKHPKTSKFVCVKSSLNTCIIYTLSVKISRYLKIPLVDLCKTSHMQQDTIIQTIRNIKHYKRKCRKLQTKV